MSSPSAAAAVVEQDEQANDSPAFRLRPRRAAPKSYYTVRLEYSANPSAFIRERPRTNSKRKVYSSKTGSQRTTAGAGLNLGSVALNKEDRELEARRLLLQREISESITGDKLISPFMQRLTLDQLRPDSIYEHNYITLRVKKIGRSTNGQLAHCLCECADDDDVEQDAADDDDDTDIEDNNETNQDNPPPAKFKNIAIRLYNEYAQTPLLKPEKLISIGKFKTTPVLPWQSHNETLDEQSTCNIDIDANNSSSSNIKDNTKRLPFMIIVKYDEFVSTTTTPDKNSINNLQSSGSSATAASSSRLGGGVCDRVDDYGSLGADTNKTNSPNMKNKRRPLIPFISITDMIELAEEPYVEMGPSSPAHTTTFAARYSSSSTTATSNNNSIAKNNFNNDLIKSDNYEEEEEGKEIKDSKRIKFTATSQQQLQEQQSQH